MKNIVPVRPAFVPDGTVSPSRPGVGPLRRRSSPGTDQDGTPRTAEWHPPTPDLAPRLYPAWIACLEQLADGQRHKRRETIDVMVRASDILPKSATNLISDAARHGYVDRTHRGHIHYIRLTAPGLDHLRAVLRRQTAPAELDPAARQIQDKTR